MKKAIFSTVLLIIFLFIFAMPMHVGASGPNVSAETASKVDLPEAVVPLNSLGTANGMSQFTAGGHILGFQQNKAYLASLDHALSVEFLGTKGVMPKANGTAPATSAMTKAPSLKKIVYENLWQGISLTYEATKEGITESTYNIAPGGNVSNIRLRYNVPIEAQKDGSLKFTFDKGYLTESKPVAWQEIGEKRVPVTVAFRVERDEVGFSIGSYDPRRPLIIDPTYAWHTFYGSSDDGACVSTGIALDGSGNIYVTGYSTATWGSPLTTHSGGCDIFVLKLNSSGAYQWHSFYGGGDNNDGGKDIAVDGSGNVYITGSSYLTWGYPLNPHSGSDSGGADISVLKLTSNGIYQWNTFYGSTDKDYGRSIAVDGSGNVYVTGSSHVNWGSPLNPHSGSGDPDIVVLKLTSDGFYQWPYLLRDKHWWNRARDDKE